MKTNMADAASSVYAKGVLVGSDKDWFHGELSTVQANHALSASYTDCFLVRVDQGALILSISHHGQLHHININYGPGWYELESGSAQYSFTELEELVTHYSETAISDDLKFTLGEVCRKTGTDFHHYETISDQHRTYETVPETTPHHYDYISNNSIYSIAEPEDLTKYKWYHGNKTQDQADAALSQGEGNKFFVRHSHDTLFISRRQRSYIFHTIIQRNAKGYQLEGSSKIFPSIPALLAFYQHSLGAPVETVPSSSEIRMREDMKNIFRKENNELKVSWKRCADLPVALSAPHVVKIGEDVYVGGGMVADEAVKNDRVFKYNISKNIWSPLPSCGTCYHGLTTLNSELIAVGGRACGKAQNAVCTFRDGEWKKVLPPMSTPHWSLATVSHDNKAIITAGGTTLMKSNGEFVRTDAVEVYLSDKYAWYNTKRLPFPISSLQICSSGDTCYTLGGTSTPETVNLALYATVSSLLENAIPVYSIAQIRITWKQLPDKQPLIYSTPVELAGRLVAVGGSAELRLRRGTRFVSTYDFATDTWVECKGAALPAPLYRPGVLKLDDSRVMIVGGQPKMQQFSTAVYIGTVISCAEAKDAK